MQINTQYSAAQLSAGSEAVLKKASIKTAQDKSAAMQAAQDFEAVFITSMLENMFTGVDLPEPFGGGSGEKMFRSLQIAEYAKDMSKNGGLGLAEHVYREILAAQEGA